MERRTWTTKERETVVRMRENNISVFKIAEMFETSETNIRKILSSMGCVLIPKGLFNDEEWKEAKQLRENGLSYGKIGGHFGLTYDQVASRFAWERRKNKNGFSEVV